MILLDELKHRGLLADVTSAAELSALFAAGPVKHYVGYDPTANSLHVGNLVPIVLQRHLQRAGHPPIAVVGGATGMIGDPSGKSDERNLLDTATIDRNAQALRKQLAGLLDFDGPVAAMLVNNAEWIAPLSFLDVLRDIGKHLTVNYMLAKDSVRTRIEDANRGISYTEFSYMILQAWDFVHLHRAYGCRLQAGGSDQWGNITAGCELGRKLGHPQLFGLTAPLLLDSAGQKMGKTASGERIWLDPARTSPYAFHQYWFNVSDADAARFLRMFSFRALSEIESIIEAHGSDPGKRLAQRTLADDLTDWVHGRSNRETATSAARHLFEGAVDLLSDELLAQIANDVGVAEVPARELEAGVGLVDALVLTKLAESKAKARTLIKQGAVVVGAHKISDEALLLTGQHLTTPSFIVLRAGKRNTRLLKIC